MSFIGGFTVVHECKTPSFQVPLLYLEQERGGSFFYRVLQVDCKMQCEGCSDYANKVGQSPIVTLIVWSLLEIADQHQIVDVANANFLVSFYK